MKLCLFYDLYLNYCYNFTIVFWKIITPFLIAVLFCWTAICFVPTFIFRFIFFNEKVFGFVAKYIWSPVLLLIACASLKVEGKDNVPLNSNFIFVCNHESWLDIPILFIASPTYLYFIAKKELKKMPFIGWAIWAAGMIFIDRSDRKKAINSMREAGQKAIKQQKNIVSFPEGTRSLTHEVMQFKRGTFIISKQTGIKIIPCAISGAGNIWSAARLAVNPGKVKVAIGKPIDPKDHTDMTADEFANYLQATVCKMKTTLQS